MSNPYIAKEVSKVIEAHPYPENMALAAAWIMANFKGINLKIYDAKESSSLCDYNVIGSAENVTQARAMVDEIVKNFKDHDVEVISLEGMSEAEWILLDTGDVIIHIFQDVSRDAFDLDSLWSDRPQLEIPSEFYFGEAGQTAETKKTSSTNYF